MIDRLTPERLAAWLQKNRGIADDVVQTPCTACDGTGKRLGGWR